jgi:hypothetical protein
LFAEAKVTITKLSTAFGRAQALVTVAAVAGRARALDEARQMIAEAEVLFEHEAPDDAEERDSFAEALAAAWAAIGDFPRALATADTLRDPAVAANARIEIGCELARVGRGPDAVALAQRVLVDAERAAFEVASVLVETGDRRHFRELLSALSYGTSTAYRACGLLAKADPASAEQVFTILEEHARGTPR